jgi:hypothetical protein
LSGYSSEYIINSQYIFFYISFHCFQHNFSILLQSILYLCKPLHFFLRNLHENQKGMQELFWIFWYTHNPCLLCYEVYILSVTYYSLCIFWSTILLVFASFSRGLSAFTCHESEWIKVESWIIPFLFSKTRPSSWLCNFPSISSSLQLLIIFILNNQTVLLSVIYSGKPRNFLKKIILIIVSQV